MTTSTKIKIFAVIGVLAGPYATYIGHQEKERLALLDKEGVTAPGEIVGGEWKKGRKRGTTYSFDVAFTPKDKPEVTQSYKVKADFFKEHASEDNITQPAVEVLYLPSDPMKSILVNGSTDDTLLFSIGIGVFVIALPTLIFMFLRKPEAA